MSSALPGLFDGGCQVAETFVIFIAGTRRLLVGVAFRSYVLSLSLAEPWEYIHKRLTLDLRFSISEYLVSTLSFTR